MIQALPKTKLVTFDEFIAWYPENSERRYELHDGVIIEMPLPKGGQPLRGSQKSKVTHSKVRTP